MIIIRTLFAVAFLIFFTEAVAANDTYTQVSVRTTPQVFQEMSNILTNPEIRNTS